MSINFFESFLSRFFTVGGGGGVEYQALRKKILEFLWPLNLGAVLVGLVFWTDLISVMIDVQPVVYFCVMVSCFLIIMTYGFWIIAINRILWWVIMIVLSCVTILAINALFFNGIFSSEFSAIATLFMKLIYFFIHKVALVN